ncbi:hypothetical protein J2S43_001085 [Catenuloplanes nepalensis]|uniref:Histidine kinase n=1 Tax=Catenuloplanes nepalensis TaxID=587533 RepID=A0ABT9MMQ4_9ACTN|nr:hypothetical protein [Catenuloplanes nepalensis]MDP9792573.1 hypothetical protein [Catenuloplanes nepalensis]
MTDPVSRPDTGDLTGVDADEATRPRTEFLAQLSSALYALRTEITSIRRGRVRPDLVAVHHQLRGMAALVNDELSRHASTGPETEAE